MSPPNFTTRTLKLLYARCLEQPSNEEARKELREYLWEYTDRIVGGLEDGEGDEASLNMIDGALAAHGVAQPSTFQGVVEALAELKQHRHLVEALQWLPCGTVVDFCDLDDFLAELRGHGWRPREECSHKFVGPKTCVHCHCTTEEAAALDAKKAELAAREG